MAIDTCSEQNRGSLATTIVLFPLVLLIVMYAGLCSYVANYLSERRVLSQMRRSGRYLHLPEARKRIAEGGGTLIIENPSIAWDFTHAWWTPEDLLTRSPFSVPTREQYKIAAIEMRCEQWDNWCSQNYTCLDNGRAYLLRVWNGVSVERKLKAWFPDLSVVPTWTAFVDMPKPPNTTDSHVTLQPHARAFWKWFEDKRVELLPK